MTEPKYPLGSIVRVFIDRKRAQTEPGIEIHLRGQCDLFVVGITTQGDDTYYTLSDLPVKFPLDAPPLSLARSTYTVLSNVLETVPESEVHATGKPTRQLLDDVEDWNHSEPEPVPTMN